MVVAVTAVLAGAGRASAQEAETVSDVSSGRVIAFVVLGLVGLGVALAAVTLWFWRTTRPDDPVLLRLEELGSRRGRRSRRGVEIDGVVAVPDAVAPLTAGSDHSDGLGLLPVAQPATDLAVVGESPTSSVFDPGLHVELGPADREIR